jgi:serine protease Do/serine protease DegQ
MTALFLSAALGLAVVAPSAPAPVKPVLRRDFSSVSDGKSPLVTSYADVVEPVLKAVISVYSTKTVHEQIPMNPLLRQFFGNQIPQQDRKEEGLGSGVIVSPDGYILTNNHVVDGADQLKVSFADGREFPAKLIGTDDKTDIAVIKIEATNLPTVVLADSEKLRVGDIVFAVGNPLEVGETVTMGIVSAKGRNKLGLLDDVGGYEDFIQTDAAINLGNSGGALVDAKGRLVGINSAIISPTRGNIGIGFAIPINLAANIMTSLIATGTVTRGYLGVTTEPVTGDLAEQFGLPRDAKGVIITDVTDGGPAQKAGLKSGDVVMAVDGKPVSTLEQLRLIVAEYAPKTKITLTLMRDGKSTFLPVTLGVADEKPDELMAGVSASPLTDELRHKQNIDARVNGLLVTGVDEKSPYVERLAAGMVIVSINRNVVTNLAIARQLLIPGRNLLLVYYQGTLSYLSLQVHAAGPAGQ